MKFRYCTRSVVKTTKVKCGICLNRVTRDTTASVINCVYSHSYCVDCLQNYFACKISDDKTIIPCPHSNCNGVASEVEILQLSDKNMRRKYKRLCILQRPRNKVCESCERILHYHVNESTKACKCGVTSCFAHGQAHIGIECKDYDENLMNKTIIQQICKVCPGCQVNVEKICGCDHMYCTRCGATWNWSTAARPV